MGTRREGGRIVVAAGIQALLFDCDGSLVDSMPMHMKAWQEAVESAGAPFDHEFFFSRAGMSEEEIAREYHALLGHPLDPVAVVTMKHDRFRLHMRDLKPVDIVVDIARAHRGRLPMGVVSGGRRDIIEMELQAVGIRDLFDPVITADDNLPTKPAPDMFLEGARRLHIAPGVCQVFEDGELGLRAARAAGMVTTDLRPFLAERQR